MTDIWSGKDHQTARRPVTEYEYIVRVKGLNALHNQMKEEGIPVPEDFDLISFKSSRLLDMKKYLRNGLVSSYVIVKKLSEEEVLEEEFQEESAPNETIISK